MAFQIAVIQPHAAFSALTHGLKSKWTYLCRTTPDIGSLKPLDDALRSVLLPALTGRPPPSDLQCALFALPARLGGLRIVIPSRTAAYEQQSSLLVTSTLCEHILSQDTEYGYDVIAKQLESKALVRQQNHAKSSTDADEISALLPDPLQRAVALAKEKGSSTLVEHGFAFHKGAFHDALALRYGWTPSDMPSTCVCGSKFSVEHALSCATGGSPSIRHNEICNLTATLLTEVCHDICIEPELQPVSDEALAGVSANRQDGARLDIAANGFWEVPSKEPTSMSGFLTHIPRRTDIHRKHERIKKRAYEQRVREIEHASFTPLVLSQLLEHLPMRPTHSIKDWHLCLPPNGIILTVALRAGYGVD